MSEEALYVICKYGGYYRPNAAGYTNNIAEAGRYTLEEAIRHSHPNGPDGPRDGITYEPAPTPPSPHREPIEADREAIQADYVAASELMGRLEDAGMAFSMGQKEWRTMVNTFRNHRLAFSTPAASDHIADAGKMVTPAASDVEGWKPIATAPKDGTAFFVKGRDWGNPNGRLHYNYAAWSEGAWRPVDDESQELAYLTDWLATPSTEGRKGEEQADG